MPAPVPPRPPRRTHLTPFTESPRPWLVLARNAVPVVGVFWLGWSVRVVVAELWVDGVTSLAAMLAFQLRAFARNDPKGLPAPAWLGWLVILALVGIPYWFMILFLGASVGAGGSWAGELAATSVLVAFGLVIVSNVIEEFLRGYEGMTDAAIRLEFNWQFSMHLARVGAILFVSFFLGRVPGLVVAIALVLSYIEVYPMRALRMMGGDKTLDAGNETRSRD